MKAADLCRLAEISYRQLDYWTTRGYLTPYGIEESRNPGIGNRREYSRSMVEKARMMSCLITLGFEVHLAERVASFSIAGEHKLHLGHGITLTIEKHDHREG